MRKLGAVSYGRDLLPGHRGLRIIESSENISRAPAVVIREEL